MVENTSPIHPNSTPEENLLPGGWNPRRLISKSMGVLWTFIAVNAGASFLVSMIVGVAAGILAGIMGYYSAPYAMTSMLYALSILAATLAGGLGALLAAAKLFSENPLHQLQNKSYDHAWIGKGLCMSYTASFVFGLLLTLINLVLGLLGLGVPEADFGFGSGILEDVITFAAVVLAAPILEELVFRGVFCRQLSRFSLGFGVIASALLFAMGHLNLAQGIPVFGMGIIFGYVYIRSGSIWPSIWIHMINNLISWFISIVEVRSGSVIVTGIFGIAILALAAVGAVFIFQQKEEFAAMFRQGFYDWKGWHAMFTNIPFWIFAAVFMIFSIASIFLPV